MLEKNAEICYFDAHFHWFYAQSIPENSDFNDFTVCGCSCAHSIKEWEFQENKREELLAQDRILLAFGIHPQCVNENTNLEELKSFLINLAEHNRIDAIGEMGFDFFTSEFKKNADLQEELFKFQLNIAIEKKLPVIIHCRKANEKLFEYSCELKKLPVVLFHSFMGSIIEANSLLNRGINGYFSFGKQMMNNNKKVIECVKQLPLERFLCETDAPFQTLKGEKRTYLYEIQKIYKAAWELRLEKNPDLRFEEFTNQLSLPIRPAGRKR